MSTLEVDSIVASTSNTDLSLDGAGTGVVNLATGAKLNGTALTSTFQAASANIPMSTLKADTLQAKTTNGTLTLANNGTGKVELPADATIGGVAMTTTFASGATTAEKSNIMLNSFRIEEQGGLTVQGMVDGVSDVFTDESGVDTATSTDETYNAAGDYYDNPVATIFMLLRRCLVISLSA
jgi:hypothetical protein